MSQSTYIAKMSTILASSVQKPNHTPATLKHHAPRQCYPNWAYSTQPRGFHRSLPCLHILYKRASKPPQLLPSSSFFHHQAETMSVFSGTRLPDPKTGFFVIVIVSTFFHSFSLCQWHCTPCVRSIGPQGSPEATGCFIYMFMKSRLQTCRLLLPVLLKSLPCILLVVEVNVVDMILHMIDVRK
jgi:hypothetical protein